jgi:hypothetical protein
MTRRPLDPRICPVAIDANALDRDGTDNDGLVDRLLRLSSAGTINLVVPKRVREEILNPRTPAHVQEAALSKLFTIGVGLNSDEQRRHGIIVQELQGNAKPGKHEADDDHFLRPRNTAATSSPMMTGFSRGPGGLVTFFRHR